MAFLYEYAWPNHRSLQWTNLSIAKLLGYRKTVFSPWHQGGFTSVWWMNDWWRHITHSYSDINLFRHITNHRQQYTHTILWTHKIERGLKFKAFVHTRHFNTHKCTLTHTHTHRYLIYACDMLCVCSKLNINNFKELLLK